VRWRCGTREAVAQEGDGPEDDERRDRRRWRPARRELAAIDRALDRSTKILRRAAPARFSAILSSMIGRGRGRKTRGVRHAAWRPSRNLLSWRGPSLNAWDSDPPSRGRPGLAAAGFGVAAGAAKNAGASGVCEFCLALRPREKRRSPDRAARLAHFWRRSRQARQG